MNIYEKLTANIILNGEGLNAFLVRLGARKKMSILTALVQHSSGSFRHYNVARKINIRNSNWIGKNRKEKAVLFYRLHETIYIENPKESIKI